MKCRTQTFYNGGYRDVPVVNEKGKVTKQTHRAWRYDIDNCDNEAEEGSDRCKECNDSGYFKRLGEKTDDAMAQNFNKR